MMIRRLQANIEFSRPVGIKIGTHALPRVKAAGLFSFAPPGQEVSAVAQPDTSNLQPLIKTYLNNRTGC